MKTKLMLAHISANTNPKLFNLKTLLPDDFRTLTEFPPMLNSPQIMFLGYKNSLKLEKSLDFARQALTEEVKHIQQSIDDLDDLTPSCVKVMAESSACAYANPDSPPSQLTQCHFGKYVTEFCKSQPNSPAHPSADHRIAPPATTLCYFATDTENRIDTCIGELIGLINRYEDFITKLDDYILRVQRASKAIGFSRPVFLRWRPRSYPKPDEKVIHFMVKNVDGTIQVRRHNAICIGPERNSAGDRFPAIIFQDLANGKEFTVRYNNCLITHHDYKIIRSDPAYARIWLENYTWPTHNEREAEIQSVLKAAFTKLLLE